MCEGCVRGGLVRAGTNGADVPGVPVLINGEGWIVMVENRAEATGMVRQESRRSRGDRPELLFRDAFVQCGLNGCPSVADGCRWVVRVVVDVFDELSGVVSRSPCGL